MILDMDEDDKFGYDEFDDEQSAFGTGVGAESSDDGNHHHQESGNLNENSTNKDNDGGEFLIFDDIRWSVRHGQSILNPFSAYINMRIDECLSTCMRISACNAVSYGTGFENQRCFLHKEKANGINGDPFYDNRILFSK